MKHLLFGFLVLIFSFGKAQEFSQDGVQSQNEEHILSFHSDIQISKDGTLNISEKIKVYAEGNRIKRGIFRTLPTRRNLNGKNVKVKYDLISVKKNGSDEKYHTEKTGNDLIIYFGSKNKILSPGIYEYDLVYETKNQIGFFPEYDEFYWNVNGNAWEFNTDEVTAKVTFPENAAFIQTSCYTGSYGNTASNCTEKKLSSNSIEWSAKDLKSTEGLTVAVGFKKGLIAPPPPPGNLEKYGVFGLLFATGFGLMAYFISTWQKYGRDPEKPIVYPQFSSPQNLSPASMGYIENGYYSNNFITAAIVSLATKGFLKIIEDDKRVLGIFGGKEYTLEKIKEQDQTLPKEEIHLMNKLFPESETTVSFTGTYSSKIENAVNDFKANLSFQHDQFLKKGNNSGKLILPVLAILALYISGMFLSFRFTDNDDYLGIGIGLFILIFVFSVIFSIGFSRYKWVRWIYVLFSVGLVIAFFSIAISKISASENLSFFACYAFLILSSIAFVWYQYLIKQPTPEKLETLSLIEGFKMYLGTAEEKTLQFHNPPAMTPDVFEKMLPFAMVLGVDKIWGEKFQNMLKNSALGADQYQSNWFIGASMMNMNFSHSLNSSLSQSIASSSTQPSSSGSGSGGGGFSGGGGGGGGGGGW